MRANTTDGPSRRYFPLRNTGNVTVRSKQDEGTEDPTLNMLDYYNIYDYNYYPDDNDNTPQYSHQEQEEPPNIFDDKLYQFSPIDSPVLAYDDKYYKTNFQAPVQDYSDTFVLPPVLEVFYHSDKKDLSQRQRDKKSIIMPTVDPQMVNFNQIFVPSRRIQVFILFMFLGNFFLIF